MAFLNRCIWTASSTSNSAFVVSASAQNGYTPSQCANPSVVNGASYHYFAVDAAGNHQEGNGTYNTGTSTLTSTLIRDSSNSGSAVTFTSAPIVTMGGPVATDMLGIGAPVASGTSGSLLFVDSSGNLAQDNTNLNWNDTTDTLTIGSGSTVITSSSPLLDMAQTWNNAAANFTAFKINVTATAYGSGSLLEDWQVGGSSVANLSYAGLFTAVSGSFSGSLTASAITLNCLANSSAFSASGYSLTGTDSHSAFSISGTWNTTGTPTAFLINVTDTASNGNSLVADFQLNSASIFHVTKSSLVGNAYEARTLFFISGHTTTNAFYLNSPGNFLSAIQATTDGANADWLAFGTSTVVGAAPTNKVFMNTDTGMVSVGGLTSSFPGFINSSTTMQCKLADASAFANLAASLFQTETALVATGGGASIASFTASSVGGTGQPATAAQNGWVKMLDSTGATIWLPVWK